MHFSRFSRLAEEPILVMMVREIDLIYVNECIREAVQIFSWGYRGMLTILSHQCWGQVLSGDKGRSKKGRLPGGFPGAVIRMPVRLTEPHLVLILQQWISNLKITF